MNNNFSHETTQNYYVDLRPTNFQYIIYKFDAPVCFNNSSKTFYNTAYSPFAQTFANDSKCLENYIFTWWRYQLRNSEYAIKRCYLFLINIHANKVSIICISFTFFRLKSEVNMSKSDKTFWINNHFLQLMLP